MSSIVLHRGGEVSHGDDGWWRFESRPSDHEDARINLREALSRRLVDLEGPRKARLKAANSFAAPSQRSPRDHQRPREGLGEVGRSPLFHPKPPSMALPRRSRPSRSASSRSQATVVTGKRPRPTPFEMFATLSTDPREVFVDGRVVSKRLSRGCYEATFGLERG